MSDGAIGAGPGCGCPAHVPGRTATAGLLLGTAGGAAAGAVAAGLSAAHCGCSETVATFAVLTAGVAGLAGAAGGLGLGLAGLPLTGAGRVGLFLTALIAGANAAVSHLADGPAAAVRAAGVGAVIGLLLGGVYGAVARPPRLSAFSRRAFAAAGWAAAATGALFVADLPGDIGEGFCGPWGCYPPAQALAAMHLFWASVLGASVWAAWVWRPGLLRPAGLAVLTVAALSLAVVVGRDLLAWLPHVPDRVQAYWPRRVIYVVATATDLPLGQLIVAGAVATVVGRRGR